jgi:hypothetical protein
MVRSEKARIRVTGLQPVQMLAGLVGVVFLVAGIVGFTRTGFGDFAGHQPVYVLGFAINPLHNLVNVVIGLLGLLMSAGSGLARTFGWLLLISCGAMFVWGLMITGALSSNPVSNAGNPLNFNNQDNWAHLAAAFVGLFIAIMPARKVALVEREEEVVETTDPAVHDGTLAHDNTVQDTAVHDTTARDTMSRAERKRVEKREARKENAVVGDEEARGDNLRTDEIPVQDQTAKPGWRQGFRRHSTTKSDTTHDTTV